MAEPPSPQQPAAAPLDAAARRQAAQASTSGSYDYVTALQRVQNRIQELSSERDQYRQAPSLLRNSVRYWRSNWSNILVLLSLYSMTTATVMSVFFSERQKQAEQLMYEEQMRSFELHSQRVREHIADSTALLERIGRELEDTKRQPWLLSTGAQRLQAVIDGNRRQRLDQDAEATLAALEHAYAQQQHDAPGIRVGPQGGQGFVI